MLGVATTARAESTCFGTTAQGKLEGGVKLPASGKNFSAYGITPRLLGRTFVHTTVRDVIVAAYASLADDYPQKRYVYAETGLRNGGRFKPHKTHQNGLSVDFLTPVLDKQARSVPLPASPLNKWGYSFEFDKSGQHARYAIDFEALGAHLVALHRAAKAADVELWRVIFAPDLQPELYATSHGDYIRKHITIPNKRSWVRHDEHYHVDFSIDCEPLFAQ